jgi:hypothetical protein
LPKNVARQLASAIDRDAVVRECRSILAAETPARPEQFALILEKLALHYPENKLSPAEQKLILQDWRRLMGELPPDILQAAVDAYVMSPARFFPTPGQLYTVADKIWSYRKLLARRAREALALIAADEARSSSAVRQFPDA